MNKKMVMKGTVALAAGAVILAGVLLCGPQAGKISLAKEVEKDYIGMESIIDKAVEEHSELAMSSNPYDYIAENPYYDSLVKKGIEILPILEEKLDSQEGNGGLIDYITAIAIEDITDCDLREEHGMGWSTPQDFKKSWDKFTSVATKKMNAIVESKDSEEMKVEKLKKYGVFAVPVLQEEEFKSIKADKEAKAVIKSYDFTDSELAAVEEYIKG